MNKFPKAFYYKGSISLTILSFDPETIKDLVWCQAMLVTSFPCPSITEVYLSVFISQIHTVLSSAQLAIFESFGELHNPLTPSELELKIYFSFISFCILISLIFIKPFLSHETIILLFSNEIISNIIFSCSLY